MPSSAPATPYVSPVLRGSWAGVVFAFLLAACNSHDEHEVALTRQMDAVKQRSTEIRAQLGDDPVAALEEAYALRAQAQALGDSSIELLALRTLGRVLLSNGRRDSARLCSIAALRAARGNGDPQALGDALILHALLLNSVGKPDSSIILLEEATVHARRAGDSVMLAAAHGNLANASSYRGDIKRAIEHYLIARDLYMRLGMEGSLASAQRNLGTEYAAMGDHARAITSFRQAIALYEKTARRSDLAYTLSDLGDVLRQKGNAAGTVALLQRSDSIAVILRDTLLIARNDYARAEMLLDAGDGNAARAYAARSRDMFHAQGNAYGEMLTYMVEARLEERNGNTTRQLAALDRAYELATSEQLHGMQADVLLRMADAHARRGDGMQAYATFRAGVALRDSLNANLRTDAVHHIETEFQLERRRLENEQLRLENSLAHARLAQERMGIIAAALIVVLLVALLLLVWRSRQMKARALALSEEQRRVIV